MNSQCTEDNHCYVDIYYNDKNIGHKNINCPHYTECLDESIGKDQDYWICNNCKYEFTYEKKINTIDIEKYLVLFENVLFFQSDGSDQGHEYY